MSLSDAAVQRIGADPAVQHIVAGAAVQHIVSLAAEQPVIAGAAVDLVGAVAGRRAGIEPIDRAGQADHVEIA